MLERIPASANSPPNANFIMDSGIENIVGRDRTFPNVIVKSAFVMGLGDTAFTGPEIDLSAIAYRISPSKSSSPNVPDNSNNISPNAGGGGNNKISDGSITTSKLADGAVTNPKIADDAVSSSQIQDSSITPSKTSFLTFHTIASGQDGFTDDGHSGIITVTGTDLSDIKASSIVIANVNACCLKSAACFGVNCPLFSFTSTV